MILYRIANAGFNPQELIRLLASHTVGCADHVDLTFQAVSFNSMPFTFDIQLPSSPAQGYWLPQNYE